MKIVYLLLSVAALIITSYFFKQSIALTGDLNDVILALLNGILTILSLTLTCINFGIAGRPIVRLFKMLPVLYYKI